jgi:hypothetical protein
MLVCKYKTKKVREIFHSDGGDTKILDMKTCSLVDSICVSRESAVSIFTVSYRVN